MATVIKNNFGVMDNSSSRGVITQNFGVIGNENVTSQILEDNSRFGATFQPTGDSLQDLDLIQDLNFVKASKIIYDMNEGKNAERLSTDEDYARYGIEMMGWFNYNLPKMTLDASRISGARREQREAFLYMMESYDELGLSWAGTGRFFKGVLLDPTTYVGLSTFGIGTLVGQGAKQATKQGVKSLFNQSIKGGIIAGVETGIYVAADDINRQVVETSVSGEDIDLWRTAKKAGTGSVLGFGLGGAVTAIAKSITPKVAKKTKDIVDESDVEKLIKDIDDIESITKTASTPAGKSLSAMQNVVRAVKNLAPDGKVVGVREGVQSLDELIEATNPIRELVAKAGSRNPDEIEAFLRKTEFTDGQAQALETVTSQTVTALKAKISNLYDTVGELTNKASKLKGKEKGAVNKQSKAVQKQAEELEELTKPIEDVYLASSTSVGRRLRAMQEGLNTGDLRGVLPKVLMKEKGLTKEAAVKEYQKIVKGKLAEFNKKKEIRELNVKAEAAYQRGDISTYVKTKQELMKTEKAFMNQELRKEKGYIADIWNTVNAPIRLLNEVIISFVFSPATVIINTVPSLAKMVYKPFLNNLMQNGLNRASLKIMAAEYSAMASISPTAIRAGLAAWKYERSLLTGDTARFFEDQNFIPKRYLGGVIRVFPRALLATDAFFEQIHYRGYAVGRAAANAFEQVAELKSQGKALRSKKLGEDGKKKGKGKQGKKLTEDEYIKERVEEAVKDAYEPKENAVDVIMQDGISRGYSGKKLDNYITKEMEKKSDLLQSATDKGGRDYVQDVLFKRDFSGKGNASKLARGYESFIRENPYMRLAGQLFFRTPVRVFEEGIRLTPGINLISPNFMKDLTGANGSMRQARAQGEALMSYAIAGSIFSLYSTGNITGSKGDNYKQVRQGENAGKLEPYNIRFRDGSSWNFRNFDPFATPVKIIVNALERAEVLAYRAEQGERVNETEIQKIQAFIAISVGSIATSIRDANLASGVKAIWKLFEDSQDPESSDQLVKFIGQKVQTLVPNTYYKFQIQQNPVLADPVTLEQFIRYRVNPDDPLVPKQYTALGRARTLSNPRAALYYFDRVKEVERQRGVPTKELEVEEFLYRMSQVHNENFTAPYKQADYPFDLRVQMTSDGKETWYDRWQRYVHESDIVDVLHPLRTLPLGTESQSSAAGLKVRSIINMYRKAAFIRLVDEERAMSVIIQSKQRKGESKAGLNEVFNIPFSN